MRKRETTRVGWRALGAMAVVAVLVSSGTAFAAGVAKPTKEEGVIWANGRAALSEPLARAKLSILDENGSVLHPASVRTGSPGTFSFVLPKSIPSHFRVAVTGGTCGGNSFEDTLLLDVEGFDPERNLLYVNAVTTLISLYRDRHPGESVATAATAVKSFLGIPKSFDPGFDLDNPSQKYFSHARLLAAVSPGGGWCPSLAKGQLTAYLETLLDELDSGVPSHTFEQVVTGGTGELFETWAEKLADSIAEGAVDEGFGWIFGKFLAGIGANEELNLLNEINAKLKELQAAVDELAIEQKVIEEDILRAQIVPIKSRIEDSFQTLAQLAKCAPDPSSCPSQQSIQLQRDLILQNKVDLTTLHNFLAQSEDDDGLYVKTDGYLQKTLTSQFYTDKPSPELVEIFEHYKGLQLAEVTLLVEAYHALNPPDKASARHYFDDVYTPNIATQADQVSKLHAPTGTVIDKVNKLMWVNRGLAALPCSDSPVGCNWVAESITNNWSNNLAMAGVCGASAIACGLQDSALKRCEGVDLGFKGTWRLPKDFEFDALIAKHPTGESVFGWLEGSGFWGAPFVREAPAAVSHLGVKGSTFGAYFSSSIAGTTGYFYYALLDSGVHYAEAWDIDDCQTWTFDCTALPGFAGALCVRDYTPPPE